MSESLDALKARLRAQREAHTAEQEQIRRMLQEEAVCVLEQAQRIHFDGRLYRLGPARKT